MNFKLENAIELNKQNPVTFEIPSFSELIKKLAKPNAFVKVCFSSVDSKNTPSERMWLKVTEFTVDRSENIIKITGELANCPIIFTDLELNQEIKCLNKHIYDIDNFN